MEPVSKKHIITFNGYHFAADSIAMATKAVEVLSKLKPCRHITSGGYEDWHFAPEDREVFLRFDLEVRMNQEYRERQKPKAEKTLALPAPKRGSILCICEKSYVAPRQVCPHCGRTFSESHNRTHSNSESEPKLRLI